MKVSFTSSYPRGDGADIRVYRDDGTGHITGDPLPAIVLAGGTSYTVIWSDSFLASATNNYVFTYGDVASSPAYWTQAQLSALAQYSGWLQASGVTIYRDDTQAQWQTTGTWASHGGTRLMTNVDDGNIVYTLPASANWNGTAETQVNLSSNGTLFMGSGGGSGRGPIGPDTICWDSGDGYTNWGDVIINTDGWSILTDCDSPFGQAGNHKIKCTYTYKNGGRWIFTLNEATAWTENPFWVNFFVGTTQYRVPLLNSLGGLATPSAQPAYVIDFGTVTPTAGSETTYP